MSGNDKPVTRSQTKQKEQEAIVFGNSHKTAYTPPPPAKKLFDTPETSINSTLTKSRTSTPISQQNSKISENTTVKNNKTIDTLKSSLINHKISSLHNSIPPEEMSNSHQVSLRDALLMVPIFDGKNIPLSSFIQGCEEAKAMLPEDDTIEQNLVKLIRSKITGEARKIILRNNYITLDELIDRIKQVYSPSKSVYQLQGELGALYMWENESVVSYAARIVEAMDRITDAHRLNNQNRVDNNFVKDVETSAIQCFIRGLRPELELIVGQSNTFSGITGKAIEAERRIAARDELRKPKMYRNEPNNQHKQGREFARTNQFNTMQGEILICQYCGKRGHIASKCFQINKPRFNGSFPRNQPPNKHFYANQTQRRSNNDFQFRNQLSFGQRETQDRNFSKNRNNNNLEEKPNIICNYCKKQGHSISECRKRIYNNKMHANSQQNNSNFQDQGNLSRLPQANQKREATQQN